jgi:hypothetical protein
MTLEVLDDGANAPEAPFGYSARYYSVQKIDQLFRSLGDT